AIVIETDGHTMAIDAGEEDDGQEIVDFLKKRNISQLDYLLITHFDKDHVGGADTLISQIPAARVLIPDYEGTSTEYTDFLAALDQVKDYPTWDVSKLAGMPMADLIRFCHTASLDISNYLGLNGQILAFFVLGNIIGGRIQDKGHPRAVLVVGGAIMAGGVLLSALACRIPSV
ncbi:MAG: MBL fold metallo-hydrolase, partial [Lachnospiraceae bacterium]|nr:MBL fold metallo-hydrolase [Lachnospiraceae bacterium]